MRRLFVAEVRKQLCLSFARSMFGAVVLGGGVIILVMAALDIGDVIATRHLFGRSASWELWANLVQIALFFVPLTLTAWGLGLEQSHDTWKMVLSRHSPRREVLFAKLAVAGCWLTSLLVLSLVSWGGLGMVLGWLLPLEAPMGLSDPRDQLFEVLALVIRTVSLMPAVMWLTLLARANGTLVGTLGGILVPLAVTLTRLWSWEALNRATPVIVSEVLALRLRGDALAIRQADGLVGPSWDNLACALVLIAWFTVPMAIAAWQFERRDLVSEIG